MRVKARVRVKKVRHNSHKPIVKTGECKVKPKLWRGGVKMNVVVESPIKIGTMAKMRQMAQEAMKAKGMNEKDVRKILGIKKYE